ERFYIALRDLRSALYQASRSLAGAQRLYPFLSSRSGLAQELSAVATAGSNAEVLTTSQRRRWAALVAQLQAPGSDSTLEAELYVFRAQFGGLADTKEERSVQASRERLQTKFHKQRKLLAASGAATVSSGSRSNGISVSSSRSSQKASSGKAKAVASCYHCGLKNHVVAKCTTKCSRIPSQKPMGSLKDICLRLSCPCMTEGA
ncbi:hypothetical protein HDU67_004237, partial [Dinochytrium kinnereticum]